MNRPRLVAPIDDTYLTAEFTPEDDRLLPAPELEDYPVAFVRYDDETFRALTTA